MTPLLYIRRCVFGATQAQMAEIAAVSQTTISKWEDGTHTPPSDALGRIRAEAAKRGLPWNDSWFFECPRDSAA
jgi:transcriptional regulator with XRE-family HTH domain